MTARSTDFRGVIHALGHGGVDFIIIGGVAASIHGAARVTVDVDVCYRRSPDNLSRLAASLAPHRPYPRGAPPGLPFEWSAAALLEEEANHPGSPDSE